MKTELTCPKCGAIVEKYLNPKPTVDIVIYERERGLVLVDRKNPPYGNALPGGFIDLGESAEQAAAVIDFLLGELHGIHHQSGKSNHDLDCS